MDEIKMLGYLAAIFTTAANLPQAYKMIKNRSTESISVVTYLMLTLGNALWLTYGIIKEDFPLIVSNTISTALCIIILILKSISKQKLKTLSDKIKTKLRI